jgi:hypothetical protein
MADVVNQGTQDNTPVATMGFGPREAADATRQAQQMEADDAPVDVNLNAIMARSQALTVDVVGKEFAANADFRQKVQDQFLARLGLK